MTIPFRAEERKEFWMTLFLGLSWICPVPAQSQKILSRDSPGTKFFGTEPDEITS